MMTAEVRKFALTAHITASVGWLGSVAAFLALAIAGLSSIDSDRWVLLGIAGFVAVVILLHLLGMRIHSH